MTTRISAGSPTHDLVAERSATLERLRECQGELTLQFRRTSRVMRKDLDLDEVDWYKIEKAQRADATILAK